ncbi:MAG: peptide chain release factor N(5)-glutamine methyltransferase [Paludibacteraceae bacterium]|nr:peptide chain release factor N(5)-glutamine methyltransferase [Paludibacteraceae bacterium]
MNPTFCHITQRLSPFYGEQEAREMAFWIMEEIYHLNRTEILLRKDVPVSDEIERILLRLEQREPLQYIFGHTCWRGLDLHVSPATLIPRPETAELVDWIETDCQDERLRVLDIGTGSGCIAIALQKDRPQWEVTALDISPQALEIAQQNAKRNGVELHWLCKDILGSDPMDTYDVMVSNPPYIRNSEKENMSRNVLDYEPETALFVSDNDPLLFYRRIAERRIAKRLYFEVNEQLAHQTAYCLQQNGYTHTIIKQDIYGKERMVFGCLH